MEPFSLNSIDKYYVKLRWRNQFQGLGSPNVYDIKGLDAKNHTQDHLHALVKHEKQESDWNSSLVSKPTELIDRYTTLRAQKPTWHAPWRLTRVIIGHEGWVRCLAVEPISNDWFATGSNDTTIRIWDLATGNPKSTFEGHAMAVRGLCISRKHPYMFSCSEDKLAKCWDLEKQTAIRDFHGHLSGVHTIAVHPTLDVIATAGRDSVIRLWDIRSRKSVMVLAGHKAPINSVKCLPIDPQVVSGSNDATLKLWDVVAGKALKTLTHHRSSVRDVAINPTEFSIASASTDDVRSWKLPKGQLLTNFETEGAGIINSLSINQDGILFSGGDSGNMSFYDYKSGHKYQEFTTREMPGSSISERGILSSTFDVTGMRLITGETDKSIKIWKPVENATIHSHPGIPWNPLLASQRF